MVTRWCLGLSKECDGLVTALKVFQTILDFNSHHNTTNTNKSEPEKARLRIVCGAQVLKLANESMFRQYISINLFHMVARLIIVSLTNL